MLENVSKRYGDVHSLTDVSLEVRPGELLVITGASGAGKTTLLGILGLMDDPDAGDYHLNGRLVAGLADAERARIRNQQFGFVFQQYALLPNLNVWQNVARPLDYAGVSKRERRARALAFLNDSGLAHLAMRRPAQLSGGEQQRVAIARAMINGPAVILADEPTGNLPSEQWQPIVDEFERLQALGRTIIVVTHDDAVIERANRVLVLDRGQLRELDRPARRSATLEQAGLNLRLLGTRTLTREGQQLNLTPRQAELLALLLVEPQGLTGEQLLLRMYGDSGNPSSLKANLSRLRSTVRIASQPYRIDESVSSDLTMLQEQLLNGDLDGAADTYRGALLPESSAPGVVELREHLEENLRQAVLAGESATAAFQLAETIADDLELWENARAKLPAGDPRHAVSVANVLRLKRSWA